MVDITGSWIEGIMLDFNSSSILNNFNVVIGINLIKQDDIILANCNDDTIISYCIFGKLAAKLIQGEIIIEGDKKLAAQSLTQCLYSILCMNNAKMIHTSHNHNLIFSFGNNGFIFHQKLKDVEFINYLNDAVKLIILM